MKVERHLEGAGVDQLALTLTLTLTLTVTLTLALALTLTLALTLALALASKAPELISWPDMMLQPKSVPGWGEGEG